MNIKDELLKLCRLQDQITHLNEAGEHGGELRKLQGQRKHQMERITSAFERLPRSVAMNDWTYVSEQLPAPHRNVLVTAFSGTGQSHRKHVMVASWSPQRAAWWNTYDTAPIPPTWRVVAWQELPEAAK
jgi:hypothetical protein